MADSNVIKEFLVSIGYKVDKAETDKVVKGIDGITKGMKVLALEATTAAVTLVWAVGRMASNLESLYFVAKRTGSTADELTALGLAARNFGSSAEEVMASAEGLADYFRRNPGGKEAIAGWLRSFGIDTKGVADWGSDQWLIHIGQMFRKQKEMGQGFMASQLADQWHIPANLMVAMQDPNFAVELAKDEKLSRGFKAASQAAHEFENTLARLKVQLEATLFPLLTGMMGGEGQLMGKFSRFLKDHGKQVVHDITVMATGVLDALGSILDFLDRHGGDVERNLRGVGKAIENAYTQLKPVFEWLGDKLEWLDKKTDHWSTTLGVLAIALTAIGAGSIVSGIAGVAASLTKLGITAMRKGLEGAEGLSAGEGTLAVLAETLGFLFAGAVGAGLAYELDKYFPNNPFAKAGRGVGDFFADQVDRYRAWNHMQGGKAPSTVDSAYYSMSKDGKFDWHPPKFGSGASVDYTVNINVDGSGSDPHALAAAIAAHQQRLNAAITREFAQVSQ